MSARRESKSLPILEHMSPREVPPLMLGGQNSRPPRRIAALRGVLLLVFSGFIAFRKKKHPFAIRPWNPSSVYIISVYMICAIEYIFYMKSARTGRHHENAQRNQWNYVIGSSPTDETAIYIYISIYAHNMYLHLHLCDDMGRHLILLDSMAPGVLTVFRVVAWYRKYLVFPLHNLQFLLASLLPASSRIRKTPVRFGKGDRPWKLPLPPQEPQSKLGRPREPGYTWCSLTMMPCQFDTWSAPHWFSKNCPGDRSDGKFNVFSRSSFPL